MKDIVTGLDEEHYQRHDLSRKWSKSINLGTAQSGEDFAVKGFLGGTNRRGVWDSVDRLKFNVGSNVHLELDTDERVITELVRFNKGVASVVDSVEYGSHLSLDLAPGSYGLSFFVEGDLTAYQVSADFS